MASSMNTDTSHSFSDDRVYPVAIAGGGVVGLTLALALARCGIETIVLEAFGRAAHSPLGGRHFMVSFGCWRVWRSLGLDKDLADLAEPVWGLSAVCADGTLGVRAEDGQDGSPLGYMIAEESLTKVLMRAAKKDTMVTFAPTGAVLAVEAGPFEVLLRMDTHAVRARLAVGCDGLRSVIRQSSGIRFEGWDYPLKAISAVVQTVGGHGGVARQIFTRRGPLAFLPLREGRANIVWTQPSAAADALMALPEEDFVEEAASRLGGVVKGARVATGRQAFRLGSHVADCFHGDRVVLAGDSAHQIHPLAGQGLNLGLKDVAALVDVVCDAQKLGLDIGSSVVLSQYTRWRRSDVVAVAAVMEGFSQIFSGPPLLRALAGATMDLMGSSPAVRSWLMKEAGADTGDLPTLMRA